MYRNRGVASIIFIGLLPVLIGMMCFAIYVSQEMLHHAKIVEAVEVSNLALSSSLENTTEENNKYVKKIVAKYVGVNLDDVDSYVTENTCAPGDSCFSDNDGGYSEFSLYAKSTHKAWITNSDLNLDSEFDVSSGSLVRKYDDIPMDVYFIIDWARSEKNQGRTFEAAIAAIDKVVKKFAINGNGTKNRFSFVPYYHYFVYPQGNLKEAYDFNVDDDVDKTVRQMFSKSHTPKVLDVSDFNDEEFIREHAYYEVLPLTDDINTFVDEMYRMVSNSVAHGVLDLKGANWNGIIGAANLAERRTDINPIQQFIWLDYGNDGGAPFYSFREFSEAGLCDRIRDKISKKNNSFKVKTKVSIKIVTLDKDPSFTNGTYSACLPEDDIYLFGRYDDENDVYNYLVDIFKSWHRLPTFKPRE